MPSEIEEKLADLESRMAFQDDLLNAMNARVAAQDKEIEILRLQLRHLNEKLKQYEEQATPDGLGHDDVPPHY